MGVKNIRPKALDDRRHYKYWINKYKTGRDEKG